MAKSRYFTNETLFEQSRLEPLHFATWNIPRTLQGYQPADMFKGQGYSEYVWRFGDRLDRLAFEHYGDDKYWWIIAYANAVNYPLGIPVGTTIKIPDSHRPILEMLGMV